MIVVSAAPSSADFESELVSISSNPLLPSTLEMAIDLALGIRVRESQQASGEARSRSPVPTREEAIRDGRLILVAEDHPTNQVLVRQQLAMLGYNADVFEDGSQALTAWRTGQYALVMIDCQMPVMDGYELARQVRRLEHDTERHTPMIALTANALVGESAKCLAAGMDDYLAKPVGLGPLSAKLEYWLPRRPAAPEEAAATALGSTSATTARAIVDFAGLFETLGDVNVLNAALQGYLAEREREYAALREGILQRDHDNVARLAHRIKGAALVIGAIPLSETARALELAARARQWEEVESCLAEAERAGDAVHVSILAQIRGG